MINPFYATPSYYHTVQYTHARTRNTHAPPFPPNSFRFSCRRKQETRHNSITARMRTEILATKDQGYMIRHSSQDSKLKGLYTGLWPSTDCYALCYHPGYKIQVICINTSIIFQNDTTAGKDRDQTMLKKYLPLDKKIFIKKSVTLQNEHYIITRMKQDSFPNYVIHTTASTHTLETQWDLVVLLTTELCNKLPHYTHLEHKCL